MILGLGLDLCEVARMADEDARNRLIHRFYTENEVAYILSQGKSAPESAAGHFAAKEAALKALGTGLAGISLREVEVRHKETGAPELVLWGKALEQANAMGVLRTQLSITHTRDMAAAVVILEG